MFKIILFIIATIVLYPMAMHETLDPCSATEKKVLQNLKSSIPEVTVIETLINTTDSYVSGTFTREVLKTTKEFGQVPPLLSCTAAYWYFQLDKNAAKKILSRISDEDIEKILTTVILSNTNLLMNLLSD